MPELLTPELLELKSRCAAFAEQSLLAEPTSDRRDRVRQASKAAGLFAMTQPAAFGGSEASQLALTVARETLASFNPSSLDGVFGPSPGVLASVGEPLATSHLAPLLAGDKRAGFGFTEPDDVPHPTRGVMTGDRLIVRGQKSYVTGGGDADFINTLVQIEDHGPSLVVIDTTAPGVHLTQRFTSLDGSHHAAFRFADVDVPESNIIGEPGQGMPRAMQQIGDTRMLLAAHACGYMLWVLDYLTEHLKGKDKSGQRRGDKDVVRWHYADARIKAYAARSMLYRTSRLADQGENIVNEAMACKAFATETIGDLVDCAIQLVGGSALIEDHPLAILYRRVRAWRLAEGASDILRLNIGRGILELDKGRI